MSSREIGILLQNNQRQHRTLHIQQDVLPYGCQAQGNAPLGFEAPPAPLGLDAQVFAAHENPEAGLPGPLRDYVLLLCPMPPLGPISPLLCPMSPS